MGQAMPEVPLEEGAHAKGVTKHSEGSLQREGTRKATWPTCKGCRVGAANEGS